MTKKDYLLIANALRRAKPQQGNVIVRPSDRYHAGKVMEHGLVVDMLMEALALENPLFSKEKFSEAVGK